MMMRMDSRPSSPSMYLPNGYVPTDKDILCGRGKTNAGHPGNLHFIDVIRKSLDAYTKAKTRIEKSIVVNNAVGVIFEAGMRFLKLDTETRRYFEFPSEKIHEKVGHSIRDILKHRRKMDNKKKSVTTAKQGKREAKNRPEDSSDDSTASLTPPPEEKSSDGITSDPCGSSGDHVPSLKSRSLSPILSGFSSSQLQRGGSDKQTPIRDRIASSTLKTSKKRARSPVTFSPSQQQQQQQGGSGKMTFGEDNKGILHASVFSMSNSNWGSTMTRTKGFIAGTPGSDDNLLLEDVIGDGELGKVLYSFDVPGGIEEYGQQTLKAGIVGGGNNDDIKSNNNSSNMLAKNNSNILMEKEVLAAAKWEDFVEDSMDDDVLKVFNDSPLPMESKPTLEFHDVEKLSGILSSFDEFR